MTKPRRVQARLNITQGLGLEVDAVLLHEEYGDTLALREESKVRSLSVCRRLRLRDNRVLRMGGVKEISQSGEPQTLRKTRWVSIGGS